MSATRPPSSGSLGSLSAFFGLTFGLSWTLFFIARAMEPAPLEGLRLVVFFAGVFAPATIAMLLTAWESGGRGLAALFGQLRTIPSGARWYLFALAYLVIVDLVAASVHRIVVGAWPLFNVEAAIIAPVAIAASAPVQVGEELGWRGYALPRLAAIAGWPAAAVVLGVLWALWHLPIFYMSGEMAGQSLPVYTVGVTALSIAMTWLYWRTQGSLLLIVMMHAAINNTRDIVVAPATAGLSHPFHLQTSLLGWLTPLLLWIPALYFLRVLMTADQRPR